LVCKLISVSTQFSGTYSALWYTALSCSVLYIIQDSRWFLFCVTSLDHTLLSQTIITTSLAVISTVIPYNFYGQVVDYDGRHCWVADTDYQLIFYGWVMLSIVADLILLLYALGSQTFQFSDTRKSDMMSRKSDLDKLQLKCIHRMYYIVFMDVFVWILPLLYRGFILVHKTPPL